MSATTPTPLFIDTGGFYARTDEDDTHHEEARTLFDRIRGGDAAYYPLYTSQAVLSEFATLALYKLGHDTAARALRAVREADSITALPVEEPTFETAAEQFEEYDDQQISFVDYTTSVLADERGIEHVLGFDRGLRTLGFSLVPGDRAE